MDGQIKISGYSDIPFKINSNSFDEVEGFEFVCWNTKADGTGTNIYPNDSVFFQTDTILYAKWKFLYKVMNLVKIGNVDVQSNIATKFNVSSGIRTPSYFELEKSNSFELVFKIITGNDVTTKLVLFRLSRSYLINLCLSNGKLLIEYTNTTSSATFMTNTIYYIKVVKNGNYINVYRAIDNVNFELVLTSTISYNSITLYLVFGQGYEYTSTYYRSYTVEEQITETTYVNEYRWRTSNSCTYADRNSKNYAYAIKLKHSAKIPNIKIKSDSTKIWVANETCIYYNDPDNWYLHEGLSCCNGSSCGHYLYPNLNGNVNCGEWYTASIPRVRTYTATVLKTEPIPMIVAVSNFLGQIDFNQSYLILNGIKYILRV